MSCSRSGQVMSGQVRSPRQTGRTVGWIGAGQINPQQARYSGSYVYRAVQVKQSKLGRKSHMQPSPFADVSGYYIIQNISFSGRLRHIPSRCRSHASETCPSSVLLVDISFQIRAVTQINANPVVSPLSRKTPCLVTAFSELDWDKRLPGNG